MTETLKKSTHFSPPEGPVVLIIQDGVGLGKNDDSNAVYQASTPFMDTFKSEASLYTPLKAHGTAVGMPADADMGNSEVGHNTLGAGRIFDQGSALVKKAIESKSIYTSKNWEAGIQHCQNHNSTCHFIGLLSDGNVHNHIDYQLELISQAAKTLKKIRLHILLDGRDVKGRSALTYIAKLNDHITPLQNAGIDIQIASGGGRMITTMDRYNADWSIVKRGWDAHVLGKAASFNSAEQAVQDAYDNNPDLNDQYIPPFVITHNNNPVGTIQNNDTVFLTNFRGDRAIELSQAFDDDTFDKFDRVRHPNIFFAGMMQYDGDQNIPKNFLVSPPKIQHCLSNYLCQENLHSFAISETQKHGHVTYFWNGNKSGYINKSLETYIEIPSDLIPFDQAPLMKAKEITHKTIELINSQQYQFGRINFPNGDMVGHTGNINATIQAVEITDSCTQEVVTAVLAQKGIAIILADHGNADEMFTQKNGIKTPKTAHTLNPVPCAIFDSNPNPAYTLTPLQTPGLANIASTICNLLGYQAPETYEPSLITPKN